MIYKLDTIQELRYESLYIDYKLNSEYLFFYFLISDQWYVLNICGGFVTLEYKNEEPKIKYAISKEWDNTIKKKKIRELESIPIISIQKYQWKHYKNEELGFRISFMNGKYISIYEKGDEIEFNVHSKESLDENWTLRPIDLFKL